MHWLKNYRFVDRDMFMRYQGGGVGHKITSHLNEKLLDDYLDANPQEALDEDEDDSDQTEQELEDFENEMHSEPESEEDDNMGIEDGREASENEQEEEEDSAESEGYADL
ncbi:hypothetical protein ACEPAI_9511 [Sanghuangporus weigelae]